MYYTICPHCGYKLLRAANGAKIELYCPKCKKKISIAVKDGVVIIGSYEIKDAIII
jgi:phage FluMu protein Com